MSPTFRALFLSLLLIASPIFAELPLEPFEWMLSWPEAERAFLEDGPGFLFGHSKRAEILDLTFDQRARAIEEALADPLPATPENELLIAIDHRRALVRKDILSFADDRARLLFLHGEPSARQKIDCPETYKPLEIWSYPGFVDVVLYQPKNDQPYKLWLPIDSKRVILHPEMEYYLEQWEELRGRIFGKSPDKTLCKLSERVDNVTGVEVLYQFKKERPKNEEVLALLAPPDDLVAWALKAAAEPAPFEPLEGKLELAFPERRGQRMVTRLQISLPEAENLGVFTEGEEVKDLRLVLQGALEQKDQIFEEFRVRFQIPVPAEGLKGPLALVAERVLRPYQKFLMRLKLIDEVSGKVLFLNQGFEVPAVASALPNQPVPDEVIVALGEGLAQQRIPGFDSLVLVPPLTDVVLGLWRAEALVTGDKIEKVRFSIDGVEQVSRKSPPFSAELRLSTFPSEQTVKAEGLDAEGNVVATDEVVINQPHGELRVRILEPTRGKRAQGQVKVKAEVIVPEEKTLIKLEFLVNDVLQATLEKPPWETTVEVSSKGELDYLTVVAELEDGARAEDVRFLNAPEQLEEVDVDLVELFTTVVDKDQRLAQDLTMADFAVKEDGKPQSIAKFELVENLPLHLGIVIDTSGSMIESLGEAQSAAVAFLEKIITPRDRCFALAFSDRPNLLMSRTSDVGAVAERLEGLVASGATALHDAVVTSLYYFRGIRGRRALILLSDGEDTASTLPFRDSLEYAKRSGVAIFTIGLRIGKADLGVRSKLEDLARETGGRTFYIQNAADLDTIYAEIERELRSQYLVAYNSNNKGGSGYREVEVKVKGGKLQARTIRGYYP